MLHVDFGDYVKGPSYDYLQYDDITKVLYPKTFSDNELQLDVDWFGDDAWNKEFENYIRGKLMISACDAHDLVKLIRNKCVGNREDFSYKYEYYPNSNEIDTSLTEHMMPNASKMEVCLLSIPSREVFFVLNDLMNYITQGGNNIETIELLCGSFTLWESFEYTRQHLNNFRYMHAYINSLTEISETIEGWPDTMHLMLSSDSNDIIQQLGWLNIDDIDDIIPEQAYNTWIKLRGKYLWCRLRFWVRIFGRPGLIAGICHFWEELIFRPDSQGKAPKRLLDELCEMTL